MSPSGCATTKLQLSAPDIQAVKTAEPAPDDGYFLSEEGLRKVAVVYKERDLLRRELEKCPSRWNRWWAHWSAFVVGAGVGLATGIYLAP